MKVIRNDAKQKLLNGELALGMGLRQARTVDIAQIAQACDFDWLFIDMEHNSMSMDTAAQICSGALAVGVTPMIRVPAHESFHSTRLLDAGAQGIVVPHVDNAEQARRVVDFCRFPDQGHRSIPGSLPQTRFATLPVTETVELINRETLVVAMIETVEGLRNADEIAAVPGVDALLLGLHRHGRGARADRPARPSAHQAGARRGVRVLCAPRQVCGRGWRLRRNADARVRGQGRTPDPERLGPRLPDGGRALALVDAAIHSTGRRSGPQDRLTRPDAEHKDRP
jgi:2-keto-3-deoxy-L-rhamnonate aldolase RhmA